MSILRATGGTWTSMGVVINVTGGSVASSVPVKNGSYPSMSTADQNEFSCGNITWAAQLSGELQGTADDTNPFALTRAIGGTFSGPLSITLNRGNIRKVWQLEPVTGPGDNGVMKWQYGNLTWMASLLGKATGNIFGNAGDNPVGTLTVQPGATAEQLSGTAILQRIEALSPYSTGGAIPIRAQAIWKNDAVLTAGDKVALGAGPTGTLTVQLGAAGETLTGAAMLRSIDFNFDFITGLVIPVAINAVWNCDPRAAADEGG